MSLPLTITTADRMGRPKGSLTSNEAKVNRAASDGMFGMMRAAPEVLRDVLHEAKVSAAAIRRAGGAPINDAGTPQQVWKQLSSHQKIKAFLDYGVSCMIQPEIAGRMIEDLMEDSKEGKLARIAMTRALIAQTPKEINIDVNTKSGVMLVPAKADSLTEWMAEQGLGAKVVEGEVNEP